MPHKLNFDEGVNVIGMHLMSAYLSEQSEEAAAVCKSQSINDNPVSLAFLLAKYINIIFCTLP